MFANFLLTFWGWELTLFLSSSIFRLETVKKLLQLKIALLSETLSTGAKTEFLIIEMRVMFKSMVNIWVEQ